MSIAAAGDKTVIGSHLLLAIGRVPNTDDLGLKNAGVALISAATSRWTINSAPMCRHLRAGRLQRARRFHAHVLQRLRDRRRQSPGRRPAPGERPHHRLRALHRIRLGTAGMTEAEVRKSGRKAYLERPMTRVGRAVEKGETQGFMKVLVDAETKEILGASLSASSATR